MFELVVPPTFKGKTYGLLGNFNDNPDDDFIDRGSDTPRASNSTDNQIFEFGKTCKALL